MDGSIILECFQCGHSFWTDGEDRPALFGKPACYPCLGLDQVFFVDVVHPDNAFATKGRTHTRDFNKWFELGRTVSLEYPKAHIRCNTHARCRRFYQNGVVVGDFPEYPYLLREGEEPFKW